MMEVLAILTAIGYLHLKIKMEKKNIPMGIMLQSGKNNLMVDGNLFLMGETRLPLR